MKKSFQIFKRDIGRLSKNIVALIVVIGVCIIPSLYAWFNIAANKDPYGNTANIKIAVANNDAGTENDMLGNLDVGGQIVDTLKENDSLGWVFVSEDKAISGVKSGEYYAAIVIPDNFSESMVSFLSGKIEQPEFDYYLNEKKNAIAPKITDTGANTIQQQVNTEFVSAAAGTVADILNGSVSGIGTKLDDVQNDISTKISTVSDNLKEYEKALDSFNKTVDSSNKLIEKSKKSMAIVKSDANSGVNSIKNGTDSLTLVRNDIADFANDLGAGISKAQNSLAKVNTKSGINLGKISSKTESIHGQFQEMITSVESIIDKNSEMLTTLKEINKKYPSDSLTNLINELDSQNSKYKTILQKLGTGSDSINDATTTSVKAVESISKIIEKNTKDIHSSKVTVENGIMTGLNTSLDTFSNIQGTLSGILKGVGPATDNVVTLMDQLENSLDSAKKALSSTGSSIKKVQERLDKANVDISVVKTSKIYEKLKDMTNLDSDKVASFMSSPVKLKTETFYSVENYGTAMTPFYTNLAIWVGGIVLVAMMKVTLEEDRKKQLFNVKNYQIYLGRYILFMIIGLFQSGLICLGDLYFLKIQCEHPFLFLLAGWISSIVYVNIIYTLTVSFGDIGKAICVILLVVQVAGSGGTFPIEVAPKFFRTVYPLLPFNYSMGAMRETIAGMYGNTYWTEISKLLLFLIPSLILGLILRKPIIKLNNFVIEKLEETKLM